VIAYPSPVLVQQNAANGVVRYTSPLLTHCGVKHGFTTRIGGVSRAPFDSLNLGSPPGAVRDDGANCEKNLARLESAMELGGWRRVWVHQVHGDRVAIARDASFENGTRADAIVSDDATAYLLVRVADCVPILLSTPDGAVVSAVHAGWRGALAGVVSRSVEAMAELSQTPPDQFTAAVGPCISRDFFEVGPEVEAEFVRLFGASPRWADRHVDLPEAVAMQLRQSGLIDTHIDRTDRCTARDRDEFFSHRRDRGITGRMAAVIAAADS
jgi:YfiH family protein